MSDIQLQAALVRPTHFVFRAVSNLTKPEALTPVPSLGPLADFTGTFRGNGFNTIFRPDNTTTPTVLPTPVTSDNILELNLTSETLSFFHSRQVSARSRIAERCRAIFSSTVSRTYRPSTT
jgi:hypothetical protein